MTEIIAAIQPVFLYIALLVSCLCSGFSLRKDKNNELNALVLSKGVPLSVYCGRLAWTLWLVGHLDQLSEGWEVGAVICCGLGVEFCFWRWQRPEFDILAYGRGAGTFFIAGVLLQSVLFATIMVLTGSA